MLTLAIEGIGVRRKRVGCGCDMHPAHVEHRSQLVTSPAFVRSGDAVTKAGSSCIRTYASQMYGCMIAWLNGCMAAWLHGYMVAWLHGCTVACLYGCMVEWQLSHVVAWKFGHCIVIVRKSVQCAPFLPSMAVILLVGSCM
jgi:hypothetical protein